MTDGYGHAIQSNFPAGVIGISQHQKAVAIAGGAQRDRLGLVFQHVDRASTVAGRVRVGGVTNHHGITRGVETGVAHRIDGRGDVRQNLDPARIARASGLPLLPVVIEQDEARTDDGLTRRWPAPDFGIQTHASYMFQWYAFAALTAAAWAGLAWRRLRGRSG